MPRARAWFLAVALCGAAAAHAAPPPSGLSRFNPAGLDAAWNYEGTAFQADRETSPGAVAVKRLRHPERGHELLASDKEIAAAQRAGYEVEGVAFYGSSSGGVAVHRFRDALGHPYYTAGRSRAPGRGWRYDGVAFRTRAAGPMAVARYRHRASGEYLFTGANESPYLVGAFYFGTFTPGGTNIIAGNERVHGRKGDWWGGVSDFYGREPGIPADRRGWEGDWPNLKPAIGYYDQRSVATLERHIRQASDAGLAFFSFYWYWSRERNAERLPEALQSFLKARNPGNLKFSLSLYAHPWDADMTIDAASLPTVVASLVGYFADPRYLRLPDGRPVFVIGDHNNIRAANNMPCMEAQCSVDAVDHFLAELKRASVERLGVAPYVAMQASGPAWERMKESDGFTCLVPPVALQGGTPFPKLDASVFAPFVRTGKPVSPCMFQNFDERPRQDVLMGDRKAVRYFTGRTDPLYRGNLEMVKQFSDEHFAKTGSPAARLVFLYAWNEWHEGGILEPNATTGAHDLNVVTDVFELARSPSACLEANRCDAPSRPAAPAAPAAR